MKSEGEEARKLYKLCVTFKTSLLLLLLVLFVLFIAPEGLDGLSGSVATEGEVEEAENADSGDDVKQNVGGGLVGLRDVVLDDVVGSVPSVEGNSEGEHQVDGHVSDGGREEQTSGQGCGQSPG